MDRLGKMVGGFYGAVEAPVGIVYDLGYQFGSVLKDPDLADEFFHTMLERTTSRGEQFIRGAFGPQGGLGSTIGALPESTRSPWRGTIHGVLDGDRWVYTNAFSHPFATLLKMGSLTESESWQKMTGKSDWGIFFDPESWGAAYRMTEHMSPGQALAENINFALLPGTIGVEKGGKDVLDKGEANKFAGTDFYKAVSGLTDAYLSWNYDPLALAGHAATAARIRYVDRPFKYGAQEAYRAAEAEYKAARQAGATVEEATARGAEAGAKAGQVAHAEQVERYLVSGRYRKFQGALDDIFNLYPDLDSRIGAIKDRLFPNSAQGAHIAVDLGRAATPAERELVMRIHMGDSSVIPLLNDANPLLGESMRMDFEHAATVADPMYTIEYHQSPAFRPDSKAYEAVDAIIDTPEARARLRDTFGSIDREVKAPGMLRNTRIAAKNSEWFQTSAWTKPLRVFTDNVSTNIIDLNDYNHIDQVERSLREAGFTYDERLAWVGKISEKPLGPERLVAIQEAETAAIRRIAENAGVHPEDLAEILEGGNKYRAAGQKALEKAQVAEDGTYQIVLPGLDEFNILPTKVAPENAYFMTPMRELKKEFGWWKAHGMDGATRAPSIAMNSVMKAWRAGVLLRPAWPLRVVGEGAIAMLGKLENLTYGIDEMRKPIVKYADWKAGLKRTYRSLSEELGYSFGVGAGGLVGGLVGGAPGIVMGGLAGGALQKYGRGLEEIPFHNMAMNGVVYHGAFGASLDKDNLWHHHTSSRFDVDYILRRKKPDQAAMTLAPAEERVSTHPGHSMYPERYEDAVQRGQPDPLMRVILAHDAGVPIYRPAGIRPGEINPDLGRYLTPDEITDMVDRGLLDTETMNGARAGELWLQHTVEGRRYMEQFPVHAADPRAWAESVSSVVHELTAGDPRLQAKFLAGERITYQDLVNATKHEEAWSHELVDQWMDEQWGQEVASNVLREVPPSKQRWARDTDTTDVHEVSSLLPVHEEVPVWREDLPFAEVRIPVDKIVTPQDTVIAERVKELIQNPQVGAGEKVTAIRVGDHYVLMDGNHRVHAALARGEKHVYAEVSTMDAADAGIYTDPNGAAFQRPRLNRGAARAKQAAFEARIKETIASHEYPTPMLPNAATPDFNKMPILNKEFQAQVQGTSQRITGIKHVVDNLFKGLGTIPIDNLIHDRYFSWVFNREMQRKLAGLDPKLVDAKLLEAMEDASRRTALKSMRDVMYNFANRSEFSEMVGMIMPFFPAWQETLQRWAGVAYENPAFIVHAKQVLDAPHKMGLTWTDENTGDEYVRFRIPSVGRALLNHGFLKGALDDQGYARFQTSGLSMAGNGTPGFGPFVDVGLQPFVRNHPDLIKSLKFVYPFGTIPDSAIDSFMPPSIQRLRAVTDDDARAYRNAYNRIILTRLVKMDTGEIPAMNLDDPGERAQFLEDAAHDASNFQMMKMVVGLFAPAALQYDSPYEPLMEKWKEMLHDDPLHAQDRFLDEYGDDFFHLTQAMTKLNNGIPATIEGDEAYQKYMDLVQRFPDLGGLITGMDGAGSAAEFNATIYQKQRTTAIRPGSDIMMRTQLSPEELVRSDDARLGWIKFTRAMDLIDATMAQRGLSNFNQKGAEDLLVLKDLMTTGIARDHPAWYAEYSQRDDVAWDNKLTAMDEIVKDPRLSQRGDIEKLKEYLDFRSTIMAMLQTRESTSIESASNADLRFLMESMANSLKQQSLAFSQLYNRYLIHDPFTTTGINTLGINEGTAA